MDLLAEQGSIRSAEPAASNETKALHHDAVGFLSGLQILATHFLQQPHAVNLIPMAGVSVHDTLGSQMRYILLAPGRRCFLTLDSESSGAQIEFMVGTRVTLAPSGKSSSPPSGRCLLGSCAAAISRHFVHRLLERRHR